jgi:hypothetical protein
VLFVVNLVFVVVFVKFVVVRVVKYCYIPVESQRFGGTFCFHLQGFTMNMLFRSEEFVPKWYCGATQKATVSLFFRFAGVALRRA